MSFPEIVLESLLRGVGVLVLLLVMFGAAKGVWWLVWPSSSVLVQPFDIIHGGQVEKGQGEVIARLMSTRIRQISDILSADLRKYTGTSSSVAESEALHGEIYIESIVRPVLNLAPDVSKIDVDFRPFNFDIVGIFSFLYSLLHRGDTLQGTLIRGENKTEIVAEFRSADPIRTLRPWRLSVQGDMTEAVEILSHTFVKAYHWSDNSQLGFLDLPQFRTFVEGIAHYQNYIHVLQDRERKLAAAENLQHAEEALSRLASEKVRCSLVYSYLGSIYSLQRKPHEMLAALRTALEMNHADRFANLALSRQGLLASKPVEVAASGALTRITSQVGLAPIRIIEALKAFDSADTVSVGILSTGVDPSLPELKDRLWPGQSFVAQEPDIVDRNGHGTNVTTLFAAIAPTAKILPIKILNQQGAGQMSDIIEGIKFALKEDVRVLLMPLGSSAKSAELEQIVARARKKGLILIAPAGNEATEQETYPAALQGVIAVGSTDAQDHKAPFSGFGKWVTLYAPALDLEMIGVGGVVQERSGGSFAATVVAGVAALVVATNPALGPEGVENLLIKTATDIASKNPALAPGARRVDALAALREAKSTRQ
jgi:hypothetical protein